ncbi:MAG: hypothetical protein WCC21_12010 [Candidatus Acidiferrales bacterium]
MSPSHQNNEWYQELCALAAIGEVSPSEFEELQRHLAECNDCSQLYADFRRISAHDLGLVAASKRSDHYDEEPGSFDEEKLLSGLLDRANRERAAQDAMPARQSSVLERSGLRDKRLQLLVWFQRPALTYGAVALVVCIGAAVGAYRFREAQFAPTLRGLSSELAEWKSSAETSEAQQKSTSDQLAESKSERESLEKELSEAQVKYTELEGQEKALESKLSDAQAQSGEKDQELAAERTNADEESKQITELQSRVENAVARTEEERRVADSLQAKLQVVGQTPPTPESQGFNDADAKELFGARDLHIVDVFDVDTNGNTQRTYGRVYYVEKKLLIFYAFDLQDKKHNRAAAGFQAWGYREANQNKPESLGLFNLDDSSLNRWVLKVSNPRVLERIDAVYVTLEPPDGSPSPRGRRLLYANLVSPPNHP